MGRKLNMIFTALILLISITLVGCEKKVEMVTDTAYMLGTQLQISVWTADKKAAEATIKESFDRISEIEQRMSVNIENSDISLLNENAGRNPVQVHDDVAFVIEKSLDYARISKGAFDPTIGKLVKLWGIGTKEERIPQQSEIEEAIQYVNYNLLSREGENKFKLDIEEMYADLGGIAKGYAADEVYSILKISGIQHAIINLGGNVFTLGKKVDESDWKVGIQNPFQPTGTHMGIVQISDKAVVTSGNYERFFVKDNKRYHHIIDPHTGYPSENGVISATIITNHSIDADALSTSVYVLGVEEGLKLVESLENVEGILITEDRRVYLSSGMKGKLDIVDNQFQFAEQ